MARLRHEMLLQRVAAAVPKDFLRRFGLEHPDIVDVLPANVPPPEPGQTWLPGQAAPPGQVAGQSSALPQPLPIDPQYWPPPIGVQVIGTQLGSPHTLGMPVPPQVWGAVQLQSMVRPQPSPAACLVPTVSP